MNVDKIYVNTYKGDKHWCHICVASIRFWYPNIQITLIKDLNKGEFDTSWIEKRYNVNVFETNATFGWGYGKLEPLFLEKKETFLVLDSDTVIVGDVLLLVQDILADFIVDLEVQPICRFNEIYYDRGLVKNILSSFEPQDFSFNSGQWFGTSGIISRSEFDSTIAWSCPRKNKYPEILKNGEQGHMNYHFHRLLQLNKIRIHRLNLMKYPLSSDYSKVNLSFLKNRNSTQKAVVHWAGIKKSLLMLPENKLVFFFLKQLRKDLRGYMFTKLLIKFIFPRIIKT
jgi:hypothetical protein